MPGWRVTLVISGPGPRLETEGGHKKRLRLTTGVGSVVRKQNTWQEEVGVTCRSWALGRYAHHPAAAVARLARGVRKPFHVNQRLLWPCPAPCEARSSEDGPCSKISLESQCIPNVSSKGAGFSLLTLCWGCPSSCRACCLGSGGGGSSVPSLVKT